MNTNLFQIIERFADLRVLVIGDVMLDSYLEGDAGRICREAPVPVVDIRSRTDAPGGAANTAANVRALGGEVTLLSVVGDDSEGMILREQLRVRGITTDRVIVDPERTTLAKHRVVAASQLLLRFDNGGVEAMTDSVEQSIINQLVELFPLSDAAIISDYGYGVLTPRIIDTLAELQSRMPTVLVADAKDLSMYRHVGLTAVKPNRAETRSLLAGVAGDQINEIAFHGAMLLDRLGTEIAAVTLDTDGALVFERGREPYRTYAQSMQHARAAGAGDTYVSALTLALAAGAAAPAAAELAQAAAAVVVGSDGTTCCGAEELRQQLAGHTRCVVDAEGLASRLQAARRQGKRIVFTNGCFDILHHSHIAYLNRAKMLGDVLVVGVNSDASVRRLRGADHPFNTLEDRLQVLSALSCIDYLIPFDEDTPAAILYTIQPDVFVKGGDYTREELPEAPLVEALGGSVVILPYLEEHPTTHLLERIRATLPILTREVNA